MLLLRHPRARHRAVRNLAETYAYLHMVSVSQRKVRFLGMACTSLRVRSSRVGSHPPCPLRLALPLMLFEFSLITPRRLHPTTELIRNKSTQSMFQG